MRRRVIILFRAIYLRPSYGQTCLAARSCLFQSRPHEACAGTFLNSTCGRTLVRRAWVLSSCGWGRQELNQNPLQEDGGLARFTFAKRQHFEDHLGKYELFTNAKHQHLMLSIMTSPNRVSDASSHCALGPEAASSFKAVLRIKDESGKRSVTMYAAFASAEDMRLTMPVTLM